MNIPLGTQEIAGKELSEEIVADVISFMDAAKTGYFCITTEGRHGIEDGLLIIESGSVVGAHYAYLALGTEHVAGDALKRVLNAFLAEKGVYDSYRLTSQQLELLKIFNENLLLLEHIPLRSLEGMVPPSFSAEFEQQELASKPEAREDVFQRHGLAGIKVDSYSEIKSEIESVPTAPNSVEKVASEIDKYINAKPEKAPATQQPKPKAALPAEPKPAQPQEKPEDSLEDLEKLNAQAEKLRKLLLKEK